MKKSALIFCLSLFLFINAYSQTEKGSRIIGGSGYVHLTDEFFLHLTPSYGHFIFKNFVVGGEISFLYQEYSSSEISLGPIVRYYVGKGVNRILFSGNLAYGNIFFRKYRNPYENYRDAFLAGLGVGYNRFLTKQLGLEAMLNYENIHSQHGYFDDRLFVSLGLQVFLPPRQNK